MNETEQVLSELQEAFAHFVSESGVERRIITEEMMPGLIAKYFALAKKELEACGPENEKPDRSDFRPMATVLSVTGDEVDICVGWPDGYKKAYMHALSEMCKTILAQGVIFRNVAVGANMEKIAKAMNLALPDPLGDYQKMKYFEDRMWKWMDKSFGSRRLAALPAEMKVDCLLVCSMGPKLPDLGATALYEWKNGKLELQDAPPELQMRMELIPRWWQ